MKKRILKITAFCLSLALIACVCWFANGLVGNPISKRIAYNAAERYVEEKYSDEGYEVSEVFYSFKDAGYYAFVSADGSMDGDFTLRISMLGKIKADDYSYRVENHGNVANRLYLEYRDMVDSVLESYAYPYIISMGFGSLEFDRELGEDSVPGAVSRSELVNDRFYNVSELGRTNGELVLYIDDDNVTIEKTAEILLKTKELLDGAGISFYSIDFVLRYPPYDPEVAYERPEGEISIRKFLSSDIYEEGILERISDAIRETEEYYKAQDDLK